MLVARFRWQSGAVLGLALAVLSACAPDDAEPQAGALALRLALCSDASCAFAGEVNFVRYRLWESAPDSLALPADWDSGCLSYGGDDAVLSPLREGPGRTVVVEGFSDRCVTPRYRGARGGIEVGPRDVQAAGYYYIHMMTVGRANDLPQPPAALQAHLANEVACTGGDDAPCTEVHPSAHCAAATGQTGHCALDTLFPLNVTAPRAFHAAVALPDGRVALIGGASTSDGAFVEADRALAPVEIYDPATNLFVTPTLDGAVNLARVGHRAVALPDGRIVVSGGARALAVDSTLVPFALAPTGDEALLPSVVVIDIEAGRAVETTLPTALPFAALTATADGAILAGGIDGAGQPSAAAARITVGADLQVTAANMQFAGARGFALGLCLRADAADAACSDAWFALGERAAEAPPIERFVSQIGGFETPALTLAVDAADIGSRAFAAAVTLPGQASEAFILGGSLSAGNAELAQPALVFHATAGALQLSNAGLARTQWSGRVHLDATALSADRFLVAGGLDAAGVSVADLAIFSVDRTGTAPQLLVVTTGSLVHPRFAHTVTHIARGPLAGVVLVVGGFSRTAGGTLSALRSAEMYLPAP